MTDFDPAFATVAEIAAVLAAGRATAVGVAERTFARIDRLDGPLNAFIGLTRDRAMAEAAASDARRAAGQAIGPLDGVPYAVKDLYDVAGEPTQAGAPFLKDNIAETDSHAVARLAAAGMVLVGKTHTVQFAFHINGTNPHFGTPHNPWHRTHHLPGGSSSGSAVAVAAGMVSMALGSDTAGSIRLPAALCGLTGYKPTGGRLGRGGVWPLSWSLDTVGPLVRTAEDAALVFEAMQGDDPRDETTWGTAPARPVAALDGGIAGLKIAVCETVLFDGCQPEVVAAVEDAVRVLQGLGAEVTRAAFPEIADILEHNRSRAVSGSEAWAVNRGYYERYPDAIDPDGSWVELGRGVEASEYFLALRKRYDFQRRFVARLGEAHAILGPTNPQIAWPVAAIEAGEQTPVHFSRNTCIGNHLNLASVTVPCGFGDKGLPIGLMISARPFADETAFRIAYAYQQATDWHTKRPDLGWV